MSTKGYYYQRSEPIKESLKPYKSESFSERYKSKPLTPEQDALGNTLVKVFFGSIALFFVGGCILVHLNPQPSTNPYEFKSSDFKDKDGFFKTY